MGNPFFIPLTNSLIDDYIFSFEIAKIVKIKFSKMT